MTPGDGTVAFEGAVTLDRYPEFAERLEQATGDAVEVDWSGVTEVDSAALSLIFGSVRAALARGARVRHLHLPQSLDALADLYGVRDLITFD